MAQLDYFSVSTYAPYDSVLGELCHSLDLVSITPINPLNGYRDAVKVHRGDHTLCKVSWNNTDGISCNIRASGSDSVEIERTLRSYFSTTGDIYWATRIDSCEDFREAGFFDTIAKQAIDFAKQKNLKVGMAGDWARGEGRTLYLGSRQSEIFIRIYEKGHQLGLDPDWVRYEVEVKPSSKNKDRRVKVAQMTPGQLLFLGVSGKLLNHIGWGHLDPIRLGSVHTPTDAERSRAALVKQYGNVIRGWADDLGGYDELTKVLETHLEAALCD